MAAVGTQWAAFDLFVNLGCDNLWQRGQRKGDPKHVFATITHVLCNFMFESPRHGDNPKRGGGVKGGIIDPSGGVIENDMVG